MRQNRNQVVKYLSWARAFGCRMIECRFSIWGNTSEGSKTAVRKERLESKRLVKPCSTRFFDHMKGEILHGASAIAPAFLKDREAYAKRLLSAKRAAAAVSAETEHLLPADVRWHFLAYPIWQTMSAKSADGCFASSVDSGCQHLIIRLPLCYTCFCFSAVKK